MPLTVSCVVITMGDRPAELARALDSVRRQAGPPAELVVVGNGGDPGPLPDDVQVHRLATNLGIPGGRNSGAAASHGDLLLFLDDAGELVGDQVLAQVRAAFEQEPRLGVVALRVVDPETGETQRRHVPRLRAGDPERSSDVTTFLGGACAIRRDLLREVGGQASAFFYGHEETDLAWRALDAGWSLRYDAACTMCHPPTAPSRHATYYRFNARNRVWLARRNLPWPVAGLYLLTWVGLTVARVRDRRLLAVWWRGFVEGWRTDPGPRRPMRWATVWRMTRLGRPPLV